MISALLFFLSHVSCQAIYPPGCSEATFPNSEECIAKNWFLGADAKDSCAPLGPYPVSVRRTKQNQYHVVPSIHQYHSYFLLISSIHQYHSYFLLISSIHESNPCLYSL